MKIAYAKQAVKALMRLDVNTRKRIHKCIHELPEGDVKRLKSFTNLYRLRIGNWHIIFTMIANDIMIEDVLPRGSAYK